jgi:hypothetical protein
MVPYEMLEHIHFRLHEIFANESIFGGINILVFGDLMQLPPVRGSPVFKQPLRQKGSFDLWSTFSFCELTENMRQEGDNTFIDILNALRFGNLKAEQINVLIGKENKNPTGEFAVGRALELFLQMK